MINKVSTKYGESFLGVAAYVLHDKRTPEEEARHAKQAGISTDGQSNQRVEWCQTRNLATADPQTAARVMTFHALDRERRKRERIEREFLDPNHPRKSRSMGRPAKGPVCHISFSWHPELKGKISKEEMLGFANRALEGLGFENQPAIVVAHNDEDHDHIHLIVSRVNPKTGEMVNSHNDQRKLSRIANKYVKELGKDYCPGRDKNEERRQAEAKKRKAARVAVYDDNPTLTPPERGDAQVKQGAERDDYLERRRASAAEIFASRDEIHKEQARDWERLQAQHEQNNQAIREEGGRRIKQLAIDHAKRVKGLARQHAKQQRRDQEQFVEDEARAFGRLQNLFAMDWRTLFEEYHILRRKPGRSPMQAVFAVMGDGGARLKSFLKKQDAETALMKAAHAKAEEETVRRIDEETRANLAAEGQRLLDERERMTARHRDQNDDIKTRWADHDANYDAEWKQLLKTHRDWKPGDLLRQMAAQEQEMLRRKKRGRGR